MRIDVVRLAVMALSASALTGCATDGSYQLGQPDNWGEANRQTMAAQIIDPAPHYDSAVPKSSGDHTAQAVDRYRTGTVKQPDRIQTSKSIGGGSGSSGN